jgi:chromate reductase
MTDTVRILGISGSLRKASYNTALLRAAIAVAPEGTHVEVADISAIPLYDGDVHAKGLPAPVVTFREQIARADALLIVTPEYNFSIPRVLKNAIDWASRPPAQPFAGKALAIMGASPTLSGTMRAQYHLRQTAVFLDMHPINKPEVFLRNAQDAFDAEGKLVNAETAKGVDLMWKALVPWALRLKAPAP